MLRYSRLSALGPVLLLCLGPLGCAQTPDAPVNSTEAYTLASEPAAETADADPLLAQLYFIPASLAANETGHTKKHDSTAAAERPGIASGYSSKYIFEGPAVYSAGIFASAAYYDWGGFPVYYPYPYTVPSSANCGRWTGTYGSGSRVHGRCGGFGRSTSRRFGTFASSSVAIANQSLLRATVGQSNSGNAYAAYDTRVDRRPENGWQRRLGGVPSGAGSEQTSSGHSNGQNRSATGNGASYNNTYTSSRHRSMSGGYRAHQRGMHGSYQISRSQMGVRRTSRRR